MERRIIIGYDNSQSARDALALGQDLARLDGAKVIVANVYFRDLTLFAGASPQLDELLREGADLVLEHADVAPDVERRAVPARSTSQGLYELAEEAEAELIVIGSTRLAETGHTDVRHMARRLLHGAPCAVAIAPNGYAKREARGFAEILIGYAAGAEGKAALDAAMSLAQSSSTPMRVATVFEPVALSLGKGGDPAYGEYVTLVERQLRTELDAAVAELPSAVSVTTEFTKGKPAAELQRLAGPRSLVVVGSRGYGPIRRVLLGSVSAALVEGSPAPVLVVPRGAVTQQPDLSARLASTVV